MRKLMLFTWVIIFSFILPGNLGSQTVEPIRQKETQNDARIDNQLAPESQGEKKAKPISISKFIPGVHQLEMKKYVKGSLLLGAFTGSIIGAIIFNKKGNDWYEKYKESINVEEIAQFRRNTEKAIRKRNLCIVGIVSVWLVHVIDLQFSKSDKAGVKGEAGKNSINLGLYYRF